MEIVTIPCLQDNFAYLLICPKTGDAAVVDPSEADPVRKEIKRQNGCQFNILAFYFFSYRIRFRGVY